MNKIVQKFSSGFTLVEALIGAIMLSFVLAVFSDYFLQRIKDARDTELHSAMQSICATTNKALASAYSISMKNTMESLAESGALSDFTVILSEDALEECYLLALTHFKDFIYAPMSGNTGGGDDPWERNTRGAFPISQDAGLLSDSGNPRYINVIFLIVPHNETGTPDFADTRESQTPSYAWDFEYKNSALSLTFRLYHTLVVTIHTDKSGLDLSGGFPALSAYINNATLPPDCISMLLHTECYVIGFDNDIPPATHTSSIRFPYTAKLISRFR